MKQKLPLMKPFWMVCFDTCPIIYTLFISHMFTAFHDNLDVVSVQEKLVEEFKAVTAATRGKQSLEAHIENIARVKASGLTETPSTAKTALLQVINIVLKCILTLRQLNRLPRSSKILSETFSRDGRCQLRI